MSQNWWKEVYEWFLRERGIQRETLDAFGVELVEGRVVFPYPTGRRYRHGLPDGPRSFSWEPGSSLSLFLSPSRSGAVKTVFLVEGETDTLRLWQELGQRDDVLVAGIPGIETWKESWAKLFPSTTSIYVILDNDQDYNVKGRVDSAWKAIRKSLGPKAKRIHLPQGVKDLCEFFDRYDLNALRTLVERSRTASNRFRALDLTRTPPPMNWLVDGLLCAGDVTLVMGDPGLGKSWLTMALAKAVASGDPTFLGKPLHKHGRVLYVDEENPEDVIHHRFHKLGLQPEHARNIRYLYRQNIWLDKDADELLDDALAWEPVVIVIDALSRVHTEDENSASQMATLFREGITPLARETGAAVLVIHHSNKGDGDSFRRARGSGDISASVDAAIDVRSTSVSGAFTVALYKSRRSLGGEVLAVRIDDTPQGGVRLTVSPPVDEMVF